MVKGPDKLFPQSQLWKENLKVESVQKCSMPDIYFEH